MQSLKSIIALKSKLSDKLHFFLGFDINFLLNIFMNLKRFEETFLFLLHAVSSWKMLCYLTIHYVLTWKEYYQCVINCDRQMHTIGRNRYTNCGKGNRVKRPHFTPCR